MVETVKKLLPILMLALLLVAPAFAYDWVLLDSDTTGWTGTAWGNTFFTDINYTDKAVINLTVEWVIVNGISANTPKFYPDSNTSHGTDNWYWEWNGAGGYYDIKNEPGYSRTLTNASDAGVAVNVSYIINRTGDTWFICNAAGTCVTSVSFTNADNTNPSVAWGANGTQVSINGIWVYYDNTTAPPAAPSPGNTASVWTIANTTHSNSTWQYYEVNVTCTGGNCTGVNVTLDPYPSTPDANCGGTGNTCQYWIDYILNRTWDDIVETDFDTTTGSHGATAAVVWYTSEASPYTLNNGDGRCTTLDLANNKFCVATDEHSNVLLAASMSTQQDKFQQLYNFLELLEHPTVNGMHCWVAHVDGTKDYNSYTQLCEDDNDASDESLRTLGALGIACAKQLNGTWSNSSSYSNYCDEYEWFGELVFEQDLYCDFSNGKCVLAGGSDQQDNVGNSGVTSQQYMDYYEIWALMDFAEYANNETKINMTLSLVETANMTQGSNNVPKGKRQKWTSTSDWTSWECSMDSWGTYPCVPATTYMDNIDVWRYIPAMSLYYLVHPERVDSSLNSTMWAYWASNYMNGYDPTTDALPFEIYADSGSGTVFTSQLSYKTLGMWIPLAAAFNSSWATAGITELLSSTGAGGQWDTTNEYFSGTSYMAGYYTQFAPRAIGAYTGLIDPSFYWANWTNSTSGSGGSGTPASTSKGGDIPTSANSPFWTNGTNPYVIGDMTNGTTVTVGWWVYANATVGLTYDFFTYQTSGDAGTHTNSNVKQVTVGAAPVYPDESITITQHDITQDPLLSSELPECTATVTHNLADIPGSSWSTKHVNWYIDNLIVLTENISATITSGVQFSAGILDSSYTTPGDNVICEIELAAGLATATSEAEQDVRENYRYFVMHDVLDNSSITDFTITYNNVVYTSNASGVATILTSTMGVGNFTITAESDGYADKETNITVSSWNSTTINISMDLATISFTFTELTEAWFDTENCVANYDCSEWNSTTIFLNATDLSEGYVTLRFNPDGSENWQQIYSFYNDQQTNINISLMIETVDLTQTIAVSYLGGAVTGARVCAYSLGTDPLLNQTNWVATYCEYTDTEGEALLLVNDQNTYKFCAQKEGYQTNCEIYFVAPANTEVFAIEITPTDQESSITWVSTTCPSVYTDTMSCNATLYTYQEFATVCATLYREGAYVNQWCGYTTSSQEFTYTLSKLYANYSLNFTLNGDEVWVIYHEYVTDDASAAINWEQEDINGETLLEKISSSYEYLLVFYALMILIGLGFGWGTEKLFNGYGMYGSAIWFGFLGFTGFYLFWVPAGVIIVWGITEALIPMMK